MKKKKCNTCGITKDVSCFSRKSKNKDKLQTKCKECQNEYHKEHYLQNRTKYLQKAKNRTQELREWFAKHKESLKCARCPESHPACLQFHHRDPSQKDGNVSTFVTRDHKGKLAILNEISKCEVLCANCHAKKHYRSVG